jgi:hypothetical protein
MLKYERKLLKFWAQSFLLGVPTIIVGFRDQDGIVRRLEELDTASIPGKVKKLGRGSWDGNICINFAAQFLECRETPLLALWKHANTSLCRVETHHSAGWDLENTEAREIIGHRGVQGRRVGSWRYSLLYIQRLAVTSSGLTLVVPS